MNPIEVIKSALSTGDTTEIEKYIDEQKAQRISDEKALESSLAGVLPGWAMYHNKSILDDDSIKINISDLKDELYLHLAAINPNPKLQQLIVYLAEKQHLNHLLKILSMLVNKKLMDESLYEYHDLLKYAQHRLLLNTKADEPNEEIAQFFRSKALLASIEKAKSQINSLEHDKNYIQQQLNLIRMQPTTFERNKEILLEYIAHLRGIHFKKSVAPQPDYGATITDLKARLENVENEQREMQALLHVKLEADKCLNSNNPQIKQFYSTFTAKLDRVFKSYALYPVGLFAGNQGNAGTAINGINILAQIISVICPWAGAGIQIGTGIASEAIDKYNENYYLRIAKPFELFTLELLGDIIYEVGLRLLKKYDNQIQCLTDKGAEQLAECAIFRIIHSLSLNIFPNRHLSRTELVSQLIAAVEAITLNLKPIAIEHNPCSHGYDPDYETKFTDQFIFQQTALRVNNQLTTHLVLPNDIKNVKFTYDYREASDDEFNNITRLRTKIPHNTIYTSIVNLGNIEPSVSKPGPKKHKKMNCIIV